MQGYISTRFTATIMDRPLAPSSDHVAAPESESGHGWFSLVD
jgi:hypothetical protein